MGIATFRGGIHPLHGSKSTTEGLPIVALAPPKLVIIPMIQHIGAPCAPCVQKGERVLLGQVVGNAPGVVSAAVHASVSGKIVEIAPKPHPNGAQIMSVVIENDGLDEAIEALEPLIIESTEPAELAARVRACGVVGMGGATFPTHVKLSPPKQKNIDTVLLNAAECEPFLTADHRLLLEHPDNVAAGLMIVQRAVGADFAVVGIEENKRDAGAALEKALGGRARVQYLKVKYPQGSEKQLIEACLGRQTPSGALPLDAGCVVINAGTAAAIANAILKGIPLTQRIVTVSGPGIESPANLLCRIGSPLSSLIEHCVAKSGDYSIITGGPMMGWAQHNAEAPVIKGTSGVLLLPKVMYAEKNCIRCGKCVDVCPMGLMPLSIAESSARDNWDEAEKRCALDCMECGACTYICPSRRELTTRIRVAKRAIMAQRRAKQQ